MPTSGLSSLLGFLAVIALIPVALWLLKRTPMGGAAASGSMRAIASLPLSPNQRVIIVEVGQGEERRWLVLGVTPQQITTLHTMSPGADQPLPQTGPAAPFAQLLGKLRGEQGTPK